MLTTSEKIRLIARRKGYSQVYIANQLGTTKQAFNRKLRQDNFTRAQLEQVASVLGCTVEVVFTDKQTGDTI